MVEQTISELGRLDILVNNAALGVGADRTPIIDLEPAVFDRVVGVKVRGTYLCTRAAASRMIEQGDGGKIVNIASVAGKRWQREHACLQRCQLRRSRDDAVVGTASSGRIGST